MNWRARQQALGTNLLRPVPVAAADSTPGSIPFTPAASPAAGVSEAEFWAPSSERLPFRVVLADFGESKVFRWVGAG
jgi:hypothetical protein